MRSRKIEQVRKQAEGGLTDLPESQTAHYVYGERCVLHAFWERRVLHALGERCSACIGGKHVLHALGEMHVLHAFDKFTYYYEPESFFFFFFGRGDMIMKLTLISNIVNVFCYLRL